MSRSEGKKDIKSGRGWKYLMFSIIGILSFFAGFYIGDEMHLGYLVFKVTGGPFTVFPFALAIFAILFSLGVYISKEYSLGFVLKVFGISFLFFVLAFFSIMAYSAHEHYNAKYISVDKLSGEPEDCLNLTEMELEKYPFLKEAILLTEKNETSLISLHPKEWQQMVTSLNQENLHTINISYEYYSVKFLCSLTSWKLSEVPEEYATITENELTEFSLIKKAKELSNKYADEGKEQPFRMSLSFDKWLRIEDFFDQKGLRTIEFEGEYFEFGLTSDLRIQKYYVNITEEELEEHPYLKKAIEFANKSENGQTTLKVHPNEWERIEDFLSEKGSYTIKVGDEYYRVGFMCA